MNQKLKAFTHYDLDGAVSALVVNWFLEKEVEVKALTEQMLDQEVSKLLTEIDSYKKIFFLDLNVCRYKERIDRDNVFICDHHIDSLECKDDFKSAKVFVNKAGSTALLLYKILGNFYKGKKELNKDQKLLIALANDYDSYTLKMKKVSIGLNTIFWNLQGDKVNKFIELFKNGFRPFTAEENKIIDYYNTRIEKFLKEEQVFKGNKIRIQGKERVVVSVFADFAINEISHALIEKYNADISIILNPKTQKLSFRRSSNSDINLDKFAKYIANGGGHEASAGGTITEQYMEFTKLLLPV